MYDHVVREIPEQIKMSGLPIVSWFLDFGFWKR